jgi:HrpA-like RNA helicase
MTPGVLLRKLGNDPELREFSHVMIDEASLYLV